MNINRLLLIKRAIYSLIYKLIQIRAKITAIILHKTCVNPGGDEKGVVRSSVEIGVSVFPMLTVVSVVIINGFHISRRGRFIIIQEEHCHEYKKHDEGQHTSIIVEATRTVHGLTGRC